MVIWPKVVKIVPLALLGLILVLVGCSKQSSTTATTQTAKVTRGNLVVSTTTTGNLAFTRMENVAFEMAGTVDQVTVEAGDSMTQGQTLATLDISAWDDQLRNLEKAVTTAQNNLSNAESNISSQELAVRQAEINLLAAQDTVAEIPAVKAAQQSVDIAQAALTEAIGSSTVSANVAGNQIAFIQQQLDAAKAHLRDVLAGTSFNLFGDVALQIAKAQLAVDQCQHQLDDANRSVTMAQGSRDNAAQTVQDAQDALTEAKALSPKVVAPFDGIVTTVNVEGGQEINKGAVAAQIADPNEFEVGVLVGERNISSIAIGGSATVSLDSMTGVVLPATVSTIAPTATIQQGVVNYQVTVAVRSTGAFTSGNVTSSPPIGGGQIPSGGQFPGGSPPNGATRIPGNSANQSLDSRFGNLPFGGGSFAAAQSATLRQGLSVTVNLITASKNDVLMVANRAIIRQQGTTYVNVLKNGVTEKVSIITGISNSQNTEITQGLAEGDTVVLQITTTGSNSPSQQGGGGLFGGPGGGGILR